MGRTASVLVLWLAVVAVVVAARKAIKDSDIGTDFPVDSESVTCVQPIKGSFVGVAVDCLTAAPSGSAFPSKFEILSVDDGCEEWKWGKVIGYTNQRLGDDEEHLRALILVQGKPEPRAVKAIMKDKTSSADTRLRYVLAEVEQDDGLDENHLATVGLEEAEEESELAWRCLPGTEGVSARETRLDRDKAFTSIGRLFETVDDTDGPQPHPANSPYWDDELINLGLLNPETQKGKDDDGGGEEEEEEDGGNENEDDGEWGKLGSVFDDAEEKKETVVDPLTLDEDHFSIFALEHLEVCTREKAEEIRPTCETPRYQFKGITGRLITKNNVCKCVEMCIQWEYDNRKEACEAKKLAFKGILDEEISAENPCDCGAPVVEAQQVSAHETLSDSSLEDDLDEYGLPVKKKKK